jgi:type I restriction enzyme S subunit
MSVKYSDKNSGEQQKIADCFSKIDSLIMAQSNKIKSLQTHRKGMMQGFFPFPEEAEL